MIFKVAWRNIWRAKVRSFIVIGSIAVGIWAGLLIIGFSFGMNNERTASAIERPPDMRRFTMKISMPNRYPLLWSRIPPL